MGHLCQPWVAVAFSPQPSPGAQLLPPSAAQESRGDVWIPEGMFSTFLETHCGLVCCGKGLGKGSAQWNGWWLGGARIIVCFFKKPHKLPKMSSDLRAGQFSSEESSGWTFYP